jgi:hypothetical protein
LSDDYFAAAIPFPALGREVYLPQYGIGRLVESPQEMITVIDNFLGSPTKTPNNALVTGYDFLIDQATAIVDELEDRGVTTNQSLIDNSWDGNDFREQAFDTDADSYDLVSLNSHFDHFLFYPNGAASGPNLVYADEVSGTGNKFEGSLVFSVGCQSGLNVNDAYYDSAPEIGADWAQEFAARGAQFIGNTGFGYGDGDLLAYSELLMLNFVQQLGGPGGNGAPTAIGEALKLAKQSYYATTAAVSLTNYDVKIIEEMTLYGLPMQKSICRPVRMSL